MDFNHRYYELNKILLSMLGIWPYQTFCTRLCIWASLEFPNCWYVTAMVLATAKSDRNGETMVYHACNYTYLFYILVKTASTIWHMEAMLQLLNRIRDDWQVWADDQEVIFLHRYADQGRSMTISYAVIIFSTGIVMMTEPVLQKIKDAFLKNVSGPGAFPIPVDFYFFDVQKYYFCTVMYSCVMISAATLLVVATDSMFCVYVQHCCGIFSALAHKLERIANNVRDVEKGEMLHVFEKQDSDYESLISCVDRHNDAIEYAELIESTYSWCFFGIVALNTLIISILGVQIITNFNNLEHIIKFVVLSMTAVTLLYYYSYMSQILIDHSTSIRDCIQNVKWYCLSLRAQKLLLFMLMRSSVPCKLTAGKIAIMSMETYTSLLKTCVSFFTFLNSM